MKITSFNKTNVIFNYKTVSAELYVYCKLGHRYNSKIIVKSSEKIGECTIVRIHLQNNEA